MAKTISSAFKAHLAGEVTTITTCWAITRRDGTMFCLTEFDRDLTLDDGFTYKSTTGYSRTAMSATADVTVNNLEVSGVFDDESITEADLRAGLFDYSDVRVKLVNWADLTMGYVALHRGIMGEVINSASGAFTCELRGLVQLLSRMICELLSPDCRADLGDSKCKIPIAPPLVLRDQNYVAGTYVRVVTDATQTDSRRFQDRIYLCTTGGVTATAAPTYDTTPGNATTDGAAVFEAVQAWSRSGAISSLLTPRSEFICTLDTIETRATAPAGDNWFQYGVLTWESGANLGRSIEIQMSGGDVLQLWLPMEAPLAPGDRFRVYAGCNKLGPTCINKFSNIVNFRGELFLPGLDQTFSYPNSP